MVKHKYTLKKDEKDDRDYLFKNLIKGKEISLPDNVDLRNNFPSIFSQNQEGSCTANAGVAVREYLENVENNQKVTLSRQYLYNKERINDGTDLSNDEGSSIRQICATLANNGCAEEKYLTYGINNLATVPFVEADQNASKYKVSSYHRVTTNDEIKQALAQGFPVLCGITVYPNFETVDSKGNIPMPNTNQQPLGGHATVLCGYFTPSKISKLSFIQMIIDYILSIFKRKNNNVKYILRNSWGKSIQTSESWGYAYDNPSDDGWGDNGYGYLTDDVLNAIKQDCWVIVK